MKIGVEAMPSAKDCESFGRKTSAEHEKGTDDAENERQMRDRGGTSKSYKGVMRRGDDKTRI